MTSSRIGFLVGGSLLIGFIIGWILPHSLGRLSADAVAPSLKSASDAAPVQAGATVSKKRQNVSEVATSLAAAPSLSERLAVLRWLKDNGLFVDIPLFSGENLSPQFVLFYGLTPAESTQLSQKFHQTRQRLGEIARQRAQLDPTSTDGKLIVTVPAFPVEGGQVYNDLLAGLASVLGPERSALFNDVSGNSLDSSFEGFGMSNGRYDVTVTRTEQGSLMFIVQRSFAMPDLNGGGGGSSGTSVNTIDTATMERLFPLLKSFPLPTTLSAPPKEFPDPFIHH